MAVNQNNIKFIRSYIMSGSKKLNNKSNVIAENFKQFRQESGYSQRALCEKLELMGLQLYKASIKN